MLPVARRLRPGVEWGPLYHMRPVAARPRRNHACCVPLAFAFTVVLLVILAVWESPRHR